MMSRAAGKYRPNCIAMSCILASKRTRLILSALLACASCSDDSLSKAAKVGPEQGGVVIFSGSITPKSVERLVSLLKQKGEQPVRLDITSPGGDAIAGMQLGRFVREKKVEVRVVGYCISACAQYIFLAAPHREVAANSLVLFHSSPTLFRDIYLEVGRPDISRLFDKGANLERKFYEDIGVKFDSVTLGRIGLQPLCLTNVPGLPEDDPNRYILMTKFTTYALSKSILEDMKVSFEGKWQNNIDQIYSTLRLLPFKPSFSVNMVDKFNRLAHDKYRKISINNHILKMCSARFAQQNL